MIIRGLLQNRRFVMTMIFAAAFTTLFLVMNIFVLGGDGFYNTLNTIFPVVAALLASLLAYQAWRNKKDPTARYFWLRMVWCYGLWCLAELTWAFYALVLNQTVPYPSLADLLWIAGYIPLYGALIARLRTLKLTPSGRQRGFLFGLNLTFLVFTAYFVVLPILREFDSSRWLEGITNILYPLSDMGLLVLAGTILVLLKEGRFSIVWRLIFSGIMIMTVSDLLFCYASWVGLYYPDDRVNALTNLVDTTYGLSYTVVGLGIFIYCMIWALENKLELHIESRSLPRYYAFAATNAEHQIINASENLYLLMNAAWDSDVFKQRMDAVIGVDPAVFAELAEQITGQGKLCNQRIAITTRDGQERKVWMTALAIYNPGNEFAGANFALCAEIPCEAHQSMPKDKEHQGMLRYLLELSGSRPQDEIQTIRVYFLETIRFLSAILNQFGGANFKNALFEELDRVATQHNLPVKITRQLITLPEVEDGKDIACVVLPLLVAARSFAVDLIGEQNVIHDYEEFEKQLAATERRDLDKYQLRAFHLAPTQLS